MMPMISAETAANPQNNLGVFFSGWPGLSGGLF
jgi:hypothetical protein